MSCLMEIVKKPYVINKELQIIVYSPQGSVNVNFLKYDIFSIITDLNYRQHFQFFIDIRKVEINIGLIALKEIRVWITRTLKFEDLSKIAVLTNSPKQLAKSALITSDVRFGTDFNVYSTFEASMKYLNINPAFYYKVFCDLKSIHNEYSYAETF